MQLILHPETPRRLETLLNQGFYIVHGAAGIGKTTAVLNVLSSENIQIIAPEKNSLTAREVAELPRQFRLKEAAGHSYVIIDNAHTMTHYAQNALLKTLEELPVRATVVMITHELERLLPTVRSRAYLLYLLPPGKAQLRNWLAETITDPEHIDQLLETTGCRPALLQSYSQNPSLISEEMEHRKQFDLLLKGSLYERMLASSRLYEGLPEVLDKITDFARIRLRQEGGIIYQTAVITCEKAQRMLAANCNKKMVLDAIALRSKTIGEVDG